MNNGKKFLKWFLLTWIILLLTGIVFAGAPTTTSDANSLWNKRTTVTFTCIPDTGETCNDINYSINNGAWIAEALGADSFEDGTNENWSTGTATNTTAAVGSYSLSVTGTSTKTLTSVFKYDYNYEFYIKNEASTRIYYVSEDGNYGGIRILSGVPLLVDDGGGEPLSGSYVAGQWYRFLWSRNSTTKSTTAYAYTLGGTFVGEKTRAFDKGNYGAINIAAIITSSGTSYYDYIDLGDDRNTRITLSDGNNLLQFYSTDLNGNVEAVKTAYHAVDTVNPSSSISGCTSGWNNTNQSLSITATDSTSGLKTIYLVDSNGTYLTSATSPLNYLITTDGNHLLTYHAEDNALNSDANKITSCSVDKTNPSVGTTVLTGFTNYTTYLTGSGIISATVSDATSGVNTCEYTINGSTWLSADKNATHCYKSLTITNGTSYTFNLRATDNATNTGTGTPTSTYTGDTIAPTTTISYTTPSLTTLETTITLTCTDAGSGCATTKYMFDSNGTWYTYTIPFTFTGTSPHTIDYNSTDNVGNKETMNTSDINMPYKLQVLYPKDQDTGNQIDYNWRLDVSGCTNLTYSDLNTDKNIYLPPNQTCNIRVSDMNTAYHPATYQLNTNTDQNLQPYLLLVNASTDVLTKITILQQTILGLSTYPNITIKIYKTIPGIGNQLIYQLLSDGKGQAAAYLTAGETYYFDIYNGTTLIVFKQETTIPINVISTTVTFTIDAENEPTNIPITKGVVIYWEPFDNSTPFLPTGTTWDINQYLLNKSGQTYTATLHAYVDGNELIIGGILPKSVTTSSDAIFYNNIPWSQLVPGQIVFSMDINQSDGNTYSYYQVYTLFQNDSNVSGTTYTFDILDGLRYGLRHDLGYNDTEICPPLLGIALFIIFASLGILTIQIGSFGGQGTVGLALVGMSLFTYLNWIPIELTAIAFILGGAFIINDSNLR